MERYWLGAPGAARRDGTCLTGAHRDMRLRPTHQWNRQNFFARIGEESCTTGERVIEKLIRFCVSSDLAGRNGAKRRRRADI